MLEPIQASKATSHISSRDAQECSVGDRRTCRRTAATNKYDSPGQMDGGVCTRLCSLLKLCRDGGKEQR